MSKTTTIYVETSGDNGPLCFAGLTHDAEWLNEEKTQAGMGELKDGVHMAINLGGPAVAVVDSDQAQGFVSSFSHAPGCHVTGFHDN